MLKAKFDIEEKASIAADVEYQRALIWAQVYVQSVCKGVSRRDAYTSASAAIGLGKGAAKKYVRNSTVRTEVARLLREVSKKYQRTADDILSEVAQIAYSDIGSFFERLPESDSKNDGLELKHLHDLGEERRAIKTIKHKHRVMRHKGSDVVEEINEYEYELWDKLTALRILSEFHKVINAPVDRNPNEQTNVFVYLPDNGFGGGVPVQHPSMVKHDTELPQPAKKIPFKPEGLDEPEKGEYENI